MSDDHGKAIAVIEHAPDRAMSPVVAMGMKMLAANPNPETLEKLLAVQQRWEADEARKAFAAALVALKRDLPTVIARDQTVDFTSQKGRTHYTHASLAGAMEAVTEPLTRHGFSLAWKPATSATGVSVTCRLTHQAGHFEECNLAAPADTSGNKSSAQAIASTITLLQRYTALSLLGIATADMKDPPPADDDPPPADKVDSALNLRAVGWLTKQGKSRIDAEAFIGRPVSDWTAADLHRLKAWAAPQSDAPKCTRKAEDHEDGAPCAASDCYMRPPAGK